MGKSSFFGGVFLKTHVFWVAAGDARQQAIRESLAAAGHTVTSQLPKAECLIFPMPFSPEKHGMLAAMAKAKKGALLMAGFVRPPAYALAGDAGFVLLDYLLREELVLYNALATAEGAVLLLLQNRKETLFKAEVLVVGYGRIAKLLCQRLAAFGTNVTVAARRPEVRAEAECNGFEVLNTVTMAKSAHRFSAVINTVPELVVGGEFLAAMQKTAEVFDLASAPGGVDFATAKRLGVAAGLYPALPAKCAPVSAGAFAAKTILQILEEREEA